MPSAAAYLAQGFSSLRSRFPSRSYARRETPPPDDTASPADLARMIESEIIPRLLVAHGPISKLRIVPTDNEARISEAEVVTFAPLAIESDAASLLDFAEGCIARGVAVQDVLLELIVPSARELGLRWDDDRIDFIDVTMGLWRMQELAYELMGRVPVSRGMSRYRALFSSMPLDQHSFGPLLVEEFFRVAGWQTRCMIEPAREVLVSTAGSGDFDLFGFTVTRQEDLDQLRPLIGDIRRASPNPRLIVLVGGRALPADPDFIDECGADGTAGDARDAVALAADLIRARVDPAIVS